MENQLRHYVYTHKRLDTNEIFYVGIGTKKKRERGFHRAFTSKCRNRFWHKVARRIIYEVEIVYQSNDYSLIIQKEIELIAKYGRRDLGKGTLVNLTDGGDGCVNFKCSERTKSLLRNNNYKGVFGKDNPFSKPCYQYELNGNFIREWESISQVERETGMSNSLIVRCLKGKTKTAHKYQWFYEYKGNRVPVRIVKQRKSNLTLGEHG